MSSDAAERHHKTLVDTAALLFKQQPPPEPTWTVVPAKGRSKCRKVVLEECDSSGIKDSVVYNPDMKNCETWKRDKGCYRNTKIFFAIDACNTACVFTTPDPHTCLRPTVGKACDEALHREQWFYNPLRSTCEHLSQLCLAGRNRFPNYAACTETCLRRDDHAARRVVVKEGRAPDYP